MLFYSEQVKKKVNAIANRGQRNPSAAVELAREMLALVPSYGSAYVLLGMALAKAGDLEGAEAALWDGLAEWPCYPESYLALSTVIQMRRAGDPAVLRLSMLALWKFSMCENIRPDTVQMMQPAVKHAGSAKNPYTYELVARQGQDALDAEETPDLDERVARYRLLNDLQRESLDRVEQETLEEILGRPAEFAPLLHAALREWANTEEEYRALPEPSLAMFTAVLGEIGEPEVIGDLLELSGDCDPDTFLHAHWAIHRLAIRYPARALEVFRAAARDADPWTRCGLAEQLNLMPELDGVASTLAALLDDFSKIAADPNTRYLLLLVTESIAERDAIDEAHTILSRCRSLLGKKDREWLQEAIGGDEDFTPLLVEEQIANFTIEQVCLEQALMEDEEEEEGEFGEFKPDEEEYVPDFDEPEPPTVFVARVERNDPCWCGSGKKYKKCHLPADEEAHRTSAKPPQ